MALQDLITSEVVKIPLESKEKFAVIRELVELLRDAGKIEDVEGAYDAVLEREGMGSTGLEKGIAVPHGKCLAAAELVVAVGISPEGVPFESLDGELSKLFFLVLAPPDKAGPHIQLLSEIAGVAKSQAFCRLLLAAKDADEVVEIFHEE